MESEELKEFLTSLRETDIAELKLESVGTKIAFKRSNVAVVEPVKPAQEPVVAVEEEKKLSSIKSPMVGTFYYSDKADRPPFVMEGNHVALGRKVGIIETMKIMKDVSSTLKGKIVKVSVKNGQPVEYGQELFVVDTEDVK